MIASDGSSIMEAPRLFAQNVGAVRGDECLVDIKDELISMRMIKMPCEMEAIRKAARITEEALKVTKQLIRPGVSELELYSRVEYEMSARGSFIPAFETIVANEGNSFCLHHPKPDLSTAGIVRENGYVQFDVGARFDGYCADISRVCFVEDLTMKQEKVLELVQNLRKRAFDFIRPGVTFDELNQELKNIVALWSVNEDLGDKSSAIDPSSFVWHGASHHLGLDVHDVGPRTSPFEAGNCLAVEPGVYIPEWGVGFRIEDDVVVTETGVELLSSGEDSKLSCIC
jgi:Xaa-Pro aminopeptidase